VNTHHQGGGRWAGQDRQDWQQHYPPHSEQQQQGYEGYDEQAQAYYGQQQTYGDQQAYGQQPYGGQAYIPQQPTAAQQHAYTPPQAHYQRPPGEYAEAEYYVPEYTVVEPEPEPEPGYVLPEVPVSSWSVDNGRSAWISRGALVLILLLQAGLSYRLDGSAFAQEAKFLMSDGQLSGLVAQFGLSGARALSLAWALGATALLFALFGILAYVWFRFEWKFSLGSIAALCHDAIMTVGFLSLVQEEFSLTTLAGVLAMLGYSNNETIVIFDRVRENLINLRKQPVLDVINLSINQTLLRSIITHFTVLMVLFCLFFFGGPTVHSFSVAMIVGVIVATYSSIYISSGTTVLLNIKREDLIPPEDHAKTQGRSKDGAVV